MRDRELNRIAIFFGDSMTNEKRTMATFMEDIMVLCSNGEKLIDAIIHWAEMNNHDLELIGELISNDIILKGRLEIEAEELNFIKPKPRLRLEFEDA